MNKLHINFRNKKAITVIAVTIVMTGLGVSALNNSPTTGASEEPPIVKTVEHQGERLDNHEARITNAEGDVKDLQNKTGTAPSTTRIEVPAVSLAPKTNPVTPITPPVTVTSFQEIPTASENTDCRLTYSDGTTYQWHWKTVNPQGAWVEDGVGQNGHWEKTTNADGYCDQRTIGEVKPK